MHGIRRPADIRIPNYAGGCPLALDVSVVSSLQSSLVVMAASDPGHALDHRHQEKWRKYGELCLQEGIVFLPLACEVLGAWHKSAIAEIKRLGIHLARVVGQEEAEVVGHLFGRLSVLLQRGNSQLILARTPTHPQPEVTGIF